MEYFLHTFNDYVQAHAIGTLKHTQIFKSPIPYIQEKEFGVVLHLISSFPVTSFVHSQQNNQITSLCEFHKVILVQV